MVLHWQYLLNRNCHRLDRSTRLLEAHPLVPRPLECGREDAFLELIASELWRHPLVSRVDDTRVTRRRWVSRTRLSTRPGHFTALWVWVLLEPIDAFGEPLEDGDSAERRRRILQPLHHPIHQFVTEEEIRNPHDGRLEKKKSSERCGKNGCVTYGENEMGGREKKRKKREKKNENLIRTVRDTGRMGV